MHQTPQLPLNRCPDCNIAKPSLNQINGPAVSKNSAGESARCWSVYRCTSCGGHILVCSPIDNLRKISHIYPSPQTVDETIPERAKNFLEQAIASIQAPAGAVMLAASSVDAMLKDKGYKDGVLYSRIDTAKKEHLITEEMAAWANEIRLDANDQRHADDDAPLPDAADAKKVIEFTQALAQFLYVLPARVERGRKS